MFDSRYRRRSRKEAFDGFFFLMGIMIFFMFILGSGMIGDPMAWVMGAFFIVFIISMFVKRAFALNVYIIFIGGILLTIMMLTG